MNIRPPLADPYEWQDSVADWAVSHQKLTEAELDRFIAEREPLPPMPAESATEIGAEQITKRVLDDEAAFKRLLRRLGLLAIAAGSLGCAIYQVSGHV